MKKQNFIIHILVFISCSGSDPGSSLRRNTKLEEFNSEFERKIYKVAEGIYSAVGFGIANSILIVGKDGLIIVDTLEDLKSGEEVLAEFRKISDLPIKAIVYTHSHPDHIFGSPAFAISGNPEVFAHETLKTNIERLASETVPIIGSRSARMYGNYLTKEEVVNVGIGPYQGYNSSTKIDYLPPTKTFQEKLSVTIAGVPLELIHAPGETDDQIYVWIPDRKALLVGDNFYKSFPNLYTIRGTWFRSLKKWYRSLDIARALRPEYLVPSHGRPLNGSSGISGILTDYRDAIQFVHDQSLRGINRGFNPDDLVEYVKLPKHLASSPYLQEVYGKVSWSVRSMFNGNLGWFTGDSADLQPLSRNEQAKLVSDLAGGEEKLLAFAESKLEQKKYQSALQLTGYVLRINPGNKKAKEIRIRSLREFGLKENNANARHYYLTEASEIRDGFVAKFQVKPNPPLLRRYPLSIFFDNLAINLDPVASAKIDGKVSFKFKDTGEEFTIHLRKGIAEITPKLASDPNILVYLNSQDWKEMLLRIRNPVLTLRGFEYKKGNLLEFAKFLGNFSPMEPVLPYLGDN
ncbi:metallo-beta-lactamase domain protein [Leptospira inadai serovar Lyme str. 10]|uniref:Metallo-beta-lactamase domain protein n=2 Tax=Leptospira inadai serovar Lyme TaxID=293084 RepID=V6HKE3_9LEPT|nr:alkyl sulfatase dimerization domain-containing protein [Leptospira inadai]EQA37340.1 metallo-beta-lactamase domain protein [Leptospira inadai serovar Lyme str. 10]PNV75051.1 MBL fold metallo-hydrolase [Leptospira inadai serovar Lyme]